MSELADYKITFRQNVFFGLWSWEAKTPNGFPITGFGLHTSRESAERQALNWLRARESAETIDGDELLRRVEARAE